MKNKGRLIAKGKKKGRMFMLDADMPELSAAMFAHGTSVVQILISCINALVMLMYSDLNQCRPKILLQDFLNSRLQKRIRYVKSVNLENRQGNHFLDMFKRVRSKWN